MFFIFSYLQKLMGNRDSQVVPINGMVAITSNQQTYSLLHRSVGALSWKDKSGGKCTGSGVLISNNMVLTSAKNIYNKAYKSKNRKFRFHLGSNIYEVEEYRFPYAFITLELSDNLLAYDYAILKLKEDKQHPITFDSFLELTPACEICLMENKETNIQVYGFPQYNEINSNVEELCQYGNTKKGAIIKVQPQNFKIQYSLLTYMGQQGCPVVADSKIIAIHNHFGNVNINIGVGRLITSEMIMTINSWREELGGKEFKVCNNNLCTYLKNSYEVRVQDRWKSFILGLKNHHAEKLKIPIDNGFSDLTLLQIIDFTSKDNCKLTQDSIVVFSKLKLNVLSQLRLDNNRIKDEGLKELCKNEYPSLKVIELDDNAVTINGLRFILLNRWNDEVEYKLYSVYSNDDGYHLKVDQNIPLIKTIIKHNSQNMDELLANQGEKKIFNAVKLLLVTPLEGEINDNIISQSKQLERQFRNKRNNNEITLSDLLLLLKEGYGSSLNLVRQCNIKTELTSKIMFSGTQNQRIRFVIKLDNFNRFNPQSFKDNHEKLKEFQREFLMFLKINYGVDTTDITIDKVNSYPFVVEASDSYKQIVRNESFYSKVDIKIKEYFQNFQLSEDEFDAAGNCDYPEPNRAYQVQERGGFPYYRPVMGKKFGIRVKGLYGNDHWIARNRNKGEWAAAFHGVKFPTKRNTLFEMMKGRVKGEMLRTDGQRQAYQNRDCINKPETVGKGVYFSPYFLSCLFENCDLSGNQQYHMVLQCRVRPEAIKITQKADYWVINKSEDARPYGIILFKREQKKALESILSSKKATEIHKQIYKDEFTEETWRSKYKAKFQEFIKQ